ncbi:MAG: serine hydrolase [Balneolaceae bacterium]|nr:serine hydrolase [Balneolaceae bacterium]
MKNFRNCVFILFTLSLFIFGCDNTSSDTDISGLFPAENLENARQYAMEETRGDALIIWQSGEILIEDYAANYTGNTEHLIFSGSKSFAGLLAAIGVKNGLFTFDTPLGELITPWDPESERGQVTLRELLNLTSGIETAPVGASQTASQWLGADMEFERGSTFRYGPTPFYIISWIFHQEFNTNPITYLNEHLFTPLGLVRGSWTNVDNRFINLSFGGSYPAYDWLQIGQMLLNRGTLDGHEIIPPNIFDELLRPSVAAPGYGITFWLNGQSTVNKQFEEQLPADLQNQASGNSLISSSAPDDLFMKSGLFGQKLFIVPSLDLVIVRFGAPQLSSTIPSTFNDDRFFSILMEDLPL